MANILHIDSSARNRRSISRNLAKAFIKQWDENFRIDRLIYRDVGSTPPGFISEDWIDAAFTEEKKRTEKQRALLRISDELIAEVELADILVISSPMYNYGMPASLKAWFDQVIRVNKTFTFDLARGDFPLEPVMSGKSLILLSSCGEFGFGSDGVRARMNHLGPHIRTASKYLGVEDYHEVRVEYQEFGDARHKQSLAEALGKIPRLAKKMAEQRDLVDYRDRSYAPEM